MSSPHPGPRNKITPAQEIHPPHYSISETRWFLETNPPRYRAGRLARVGAVAEVVEAIATPGSDRPRRMSLR